MSNELPPTHDILPVPEGLDRSTLEFVMEQVGAIALDYELDPVLHQVDHENPGSIDEFIAQLEEQIKQSKRESDQKEGALIILSQLMGILKRAYEQSHDY